MNNQDHDILIQVNTCVKSIEARLKKLNGQVAKNSKFRTQGYLIASLLGMLIVPIFISLVVKQF